MELSSVAHTSRLDLEADVSCAYNGGTDLPHLSSPYAQNRDTGSVAGPAEARAAEAATPATPWICFIVSTYQLTSCPLIQTPGNQRMATV